MSKRIDSIWLQNFKEAKEQEVVIPIKKPGVCDTCCKGTFTLKVENHVLLRLCKTCNELYNPDTNTIIRKGVMGK